MAIGGALPNFRSLYQAAPGNMLVGADWSQIELWVRGAVTGDEVLLNHMKSDVYRANAVEWFDLKGTEEMTKSRFKEKFYDQRQASKTGHLAAQYGAGFGPFYRNLLEMDRNFPFKLARALFAKFPITYWRTVEWWAEEMARVQRLGYSETHILHRRIVYPAMPDRSKVANFPIQGTASDIANIVMDLLDRALERINKRAMPLQIWRLPEDEVQKPCGLVLQVHDFFGVECWEALTDEVADVMKRLMGETEFTINNKVWKFGVEVKRGPWWSDI